VSLAVVSKWESIPRFADLEEEARFWEGHQIGLSLMHTSLVSTDANESTTITLRMDPRMLSRLKRLARQRYLNYQSMLKQWVAERLEKELGPPTTPAPPSASEKSGKPLA
jgi:predicted DNA binding CopG/RHH family protein